MHEFRRIAEIIMFCKERTRCCVVFVAGHDEKVNKTADSFRNIQKIVYKALKNIKFTLDSDIERTLRSIRTEPCAHAARKQHRADMPRTQLRHARIKEFISASAYFRKLRNTDRSDSAAFFRLFIRADNGKIDLFDLIEQCGALRFIKLIIVFKQVLLPEICKFCICLRISVYIFAVWNAHVFLPPFCN